MIPKYTALRGTTTTRSSWKNTAREWKSAACVRRRSSIAIIRLPSSSFLTTSGESSGPNKVRRDCVQKKVIYHCSLSCNYATPSILQDSRADGSTHRRSQVDCRRRPGGRVRLRGLVICVNERLLERYCLRHCNLLHTCVRWHYRTVFSALIIRLLIFST